MQRHCLVVVRLIPLCVSIHSFPNILHEVFLPVLFRFNTSQLKVSRADLMDVLSAQRGSLFGHLKWDGNRIKELTGIVKRCVSYRCDKHTVGSEMLQLLCQGKNHLFVFAVYGFISLHREELVDAIKAQNAGIVPDRLEDLSYPQKSLFYRVF